MEAIDQLVIRRRRFRQDAEPAERIDPVVILEHARRKTRPADAVEAVAAADEIAFDLLRLTVMTEPDFGIAAAEVVNAGVRDLEENLAAVGQTLSDQVGDDLLLIVDEHPLADQLMKIDVAGFAPERNIDAVVHHRLALQPRADAGVDQHLRHPVLHQPGAHPRLAIGAASILDHDAGNAGEMQQMRQHQPRRSRSHDADLGPHGSSGFQRECARPSPYPRDGSRNLWPVWRATERTHRPRPMVVVTRPAAY